MMDLLFVIHTVTIDTMLNFNIGLNFGHNIGLNFVMHEQSFTLSSLFILRNVVKCGNTLVNTRHIKSAFSIQNRSKLKDNKA